MSRLDEIRERAGCTRLASLIDDAQDRAWLLARVDELAALLRESHPDLRGDGTVRACTDWLNDVRAALKRLEEK